ncbi:hypothetical protein [Pseudogulbenkiania sp. MAI-1]|uniref:hypothetical protein n=1 Tax=Pseudogulbenkiania sp. MAI-1 TaxID=990370 RepID=UPI001E3C682D|nr:hypothetical protein [Pseudogulbenkiania sp. MAI-1]
MLSQRQRWAILGGGLVLTLVLAAWPDTEELGAEAVVEAVPKSTASARQDRGKQDKGKEPVLLAMSMDTLQRGPAAEGEEQEVKDIFARQSWYVPPPPPKPAPPAPPPLPFTYLGKVIDGGQVTVFVTQGDRNLAVKTGDVIDGTYRVDAIAPPMMTLTFLPLSMQQSLEIGGAN